MKRTELELASVAGLPGKAKYGIFKSLGNVFRRVAGIHLEIFPRDLPEDIFTSSCLTHEASRIYRTIMVEFECERAKASLEARRQVFRV